MKCLTKFAVFYPLFLLQFFIMHNSYAISSIQQEENSALRLIHFSNSEPAIWNPPPTDVPFNSTKTAELINGEPDKFTGTITYGLSDFCAEALFCDPNYQFTIDISAQNKNCTLNKTELGRPGNLWKYFLKSEYANNEGQLNCTISMTAQYSPSLNVKIINYSSRSTGTGGVLGFGWVSTYEKTSCIADNPTDCYLAAEIHVRPEESSPIYTFYADPNVNILDAQITYPIIKDMSIPEGAYSVIVEVQNGEDIIDRCKARIFPEMTGSIQYFARATQYGSEEENLCYVYVTRVNNEK